MNGREDTQGLTGSPAPQEAARLVLITGALAVLFTTVTLWALCGWEAEEQPSPVTEPPHPVSASSPPDESKAPTSTTSPAPAPREDLPRGRLMDPVDVGALLAEDFQFYNMVGKLGFAKLRAALGGERAVTILNVWAPYCEPCKREFPGFRALQEGWGSKVRFLPIQLGEGDPGALKDAMPTARHHLIDYVPGGAVQQTLAKLALLPSNVPIPITLVLDCKNQLRWIQAGEVDDMAAFNGVITTLTGELGGAYCASASPRSGDPPAKSGTEPREGPQSCGNGRCERLKGVEDCDSCPEDCGCGPGQLCARQAGGRHLCADDVE